MQANWNVGHNFYRQSLASLEASDESYAEQEEEVRVAGYRKPGRIPPRLAF
jgi:hypothetical protein